MKTVQDYLALPYTLTVRWDEESNLFVGRVKEIPSCSAHGDTRAAALGMLEENLEDWIAVCLEDGDDIPVPDEATALPSGKWVQRVPRSLHKKLVEASNEEGVSLNQFVLTCLAEAVGEQRAKQAQKPTLQLEASAEASTIFHIISHGQLQEWPDEATKGYTSGPQPLWFSPAGAPAFGDQMLDIARSSCADLPPIAEQGPEPKKGDAKREKQTNTRNLHN